MGGRVRARPATLSARAAPPTRLPARAAGIAGLVRELGRRAEAARVGRVRGVGHAEGEVADLPGVGHVGAGVGLARDVDAVGTDGRVADIKTRGPDHLLETEARRIIASLPQMKPGKQRNRTVKVPYSIPINFKLM